MEIIPAVDVLDGMVVRLERGDFGARSEFGADPSDQVHRFGELVDLVHVVDLGAARSGVPTPGLVSQIAESGTPFQIGGGVRSADVAATMVAAGAARVVVGSAGIWQPDVLGEMVAEVGAERVVAAIDVRDGRARGGGWEDEGLPLSAVMANAREAGVARILVTAIERDGTLEGPDLRLLEEAMAIEPWEVIASGGVGTLDDIAALRDAGLPAAIVGRALYDEVFTLGEAIEVASDADGR